MERVIQDIWIIKESGIVLFNHNLEPELDAQLLGGLMSALNTFAEKVSDGGLTNFDLINKRFTLIKRKGYLFVASSDKKKKDKKVERDLQKIQTFFFKKYDIIDLKSWDGEIGYFKEFQTLIKHLLIEKIEKEVKEPIADVKETKKEAKEPKKEVKKLKKSDKNTDPEKNIKKLEAISRISDLKADAQQYKLNGAFDDAITCAEQIIRIAIQYDLHSYMKEQQEFINNIAKKLQKEHTISQIEEFASWIDAQYDKLIQANEIAQAHDLVTNLKESYKDLPYLDTISSVQELIKKDNITWIKYMNA